jgi:hypothetical protein
MQSHNATTPESEHELTPFGIKGGTDSGNPHGRLVSVFHNGKQHLQPAHNRTDGTVIALFPLWETNSN